MTVKLARRAEISESLDYLEREEVIDGWYSYSPGDRRGRRWRVWGHGREFVMTTAETERFLSGALMVIETVRGTN